MDKQMENTEGHVNRNSGADPLEKTRRGTVDWTRTSEEVWKDIESSIERMERPAPVISRFRYLAAAVILALAGIASVIMLYTREYSTSTDQVSEITLPDGSAIKLSSNTQVSFHPFTWFIFRRVSLDGEAFFNVEKGKKFTVVSDPGKTEVLGTSFNILAAGNIYEVTCFTGMVKVKVSATGATEIITADQKAAVTGPGMLEVNTVAVAEESTAWMRGEFYFTSEPLNDVLLKIGRSYGKVIVYEADEDHLYTGNFSKGKDIEDILEVVCDPFGLKFEVTDEGGYRVW
jgi:transmembrane sensor